MSTELRDLGFTSFWSMPHGNDLSLKEKLCGQTLHHGGHAYTRSGDSERWFCSGATPTTLNREQELRYWSKSDLITHILELENVDG